jgi:hypothetical protein
MLRVDDRDDAVEHQLRPHFVIDKERLSHGSGIGQARRFDHDVIEFIAPLHQVAEDSNQIAAHGAANAAVVHLEDFFFGANDQFLINADLAEFVLNHRNALAVVLCKDPV